MEVKMEKGLRITFAAHFIIAGIVGLQHLAAPRLWTDLAGIEIYETVTWRLIGASLIAFAYGSFTAFKTNSWHRAGIMAGINIIWSFLGVILIIYGILYEGLPALEWLNVIILFVFLVLFSFYTYRAEKRG